MRLFTIGDVNTPAGPNDAVLFADGLGKTFRIYPTPWSRAAEWLSFGRRTTHTPFVALNDVSFTLRRGESLGVIGVNGSGKSTLLKILSGALHPTAGRCDVRGRVLSLLELGTGVNPQLTGRQNVLASAELLGFPPGYAAEKLPDIEAFADLPDAFFDRPVSLYSSGMLVRLVFSMFACFEPDVFIVDEALSVGDVFFQQKCARRLQAMREAGTTMLFVSHDLAAVEALCDRVLVLHGGTVRHLGDKQTGIRLYYALSGAADPRRGSAQGTVGSSATGAGADHPATRDDSAGVGPALPAMHPPLAESSDLGDGRVRILAVGFRRDDNAETPIVHQGQWLQVVVQCQATADVGPVNGGIAIVDRFDRLLFARGWINAGLQPIWVKTGERFVASFRLNVDLEPGEYSLTLSAAEPLRRDDAPGGWDQDVGGARYAEVKHAAKIAVLPRPDGAKTHYGPSPLASELTFAVEPAPPGVSTAVEPALVRD